MSETALEINHSNFKQNRSAYGITLRDVADRAGVSVMTVSNYEQFDSSYIRTRNRDDNAKRIERALSELIDERVVRTFPNAVKEEKVVEEKKKKGEYHPCLNVFDRKYVTDKIKQYCIDEKISLAEFCRMCDVTTSNFAECTVRDHPNLYPKTISKIIKATGWSIDMFKEEKNIPFSSKNKKEDKISDTTEKENQQFIFRDGKYFMEFDQIVIEHKVEEISKEEFLKHIN